MLNTKKEILKKGASEQIKKEEHLQIKTYLPNKILIISIAGMRIYADSGKEEILKRLDYNQTIINQSINIRYDYPTNNHIPPYTPYIYSPQPPKEADQKSYIAIRKRQTLLSLNTLDIIKLLYAQKKISHTRYKKLTTGKNPKLTTREKRHINIYLKTRKAEKHRPTSIIGLTAKATRTPRYRTKTHIVAIKNNLNTDNPIIQKIIQEEALKKISQSNKYINPTF